MDRPVVTVLGGSSVSTPLLAEALADLTRQGALPPIHLRLWGRDTSRLEGVAAHAAWRAQGAPVRVVAAPSLDEALHEAEIVIGQIRPGGFLERAQDEAIPLHHGVPGDEGLGPGGLRLWLRSRGPLDALYEAVAARAPEALLLMLSSPLGLCVARARRRYGLRCYGVCELIGATASALLRRAEPALGVALTPRWAGLNHLSWIHSLTDPAGEERIDEVLGHDLILSNVEYFHIDQIRRWGAVPVPYLRLLLDPTAELARQRSLPRRRGEALHDWSSRLESAYRSGPDHAAAAALLGERQVDWYAEAVAPAVATALGHTPRRLSLVGPASGALPGVEHDAIVELPHGLCRAGAWPEPVPPLPPGPAALTRRLIDWESAVHALPEHPTAADLLPVLAAHPMVPDGDVAGRLAEALGPPAVSPQPATFSA